MRAEGPATCLCDELCVSLHVAVALNLEGLPSARAAARAASLVIQYQVIPLKSKLTWDHFWGQEGFFLALFFLPQGFCELLVWTGCHVSDLSAEVPQTLLGPQECAPVAHRCFISELARAL